jgi:dTDP-4-dehydrorhamnose reductase
MKVLVLGASGMLGNAIFRVLSEHSKLDVFGTVRSASLKRFFNSLQAEKLLTNVDVEHQDSLIQAFSSIRPNVVINCIGLIKQLPKSNDPLQSISINSLLPHRLARLCELSHARLIHISTDCVFVGNKGGYTELDYCDANDLYGASKHLGEVSYPHTVNLRTSIIGHELETTHGLVEWFLSQKKDCKGYSRSIFSGLPTVVVSQIIRDVVIPKTELSGVYHLAAQPIKKYDLLKLIAEVYNKSINIKPDDAVVIDRSLNADKFQKATGYIPPDWPELIRMMRAYK